MKRGGRESDFNTELKRRRSEWDLVRADDDGGQRERAAATAREVGISILKNLVNHNFPTDFLMWDKFEVRDLIPLQKEILFDPYLRDFIHIHCSFQEIEAYITHITFVIGENTVAKTVERYYSISENGVRENRFNDMVGCLYKKILDVAEDLIKNKPPLREWKKTDFDSFRKILKEEMCLNKVIQRISERQQSKLKTDFKEQVKMEEKVPEEEME